jgi:hypothetical protein
MGKKSAFGSGQVALHITYLLQPFYGTYPTILANEKHTRKTKNFMLLVKKKSILISNDKSRNTITGLPVK